MQTENITVFIDQRPDCLAQHRMKKRKSIRVHLTEKQRRNSPMQRGNPGREIQRGDWVLTPPLKRLLLVVLAVESISKILQLRLERLRLESLRVDVSTEPVSRTVSKSNQTGSHQLMGIQELDCNVASPFSTLAFHDA